MRDDVDEPARPSRATPSGMPTILSAINNASTVEVSPDMVVSMLRGEGGHSSHLRALFGDVSLVVLERVAAAAGITSATLLISYRRAQMTAGAENGEINALGQADAGASDGAPTSFTGAEPT